MHAAPDAERGGSQDEVAGAGRPDSFRNDDVQAAYKLAFGEDKKDMATTDELMPGSLEYVNSDVPNHMLQIHRARNDGYVTGGWTYKGRSPIGQAKVKWRLKQGPELAHKNWGRPSRLKVSSGSSRGRRLEHPAGIEVRPSMHKVKKAIFDLMHSLNLWNDASVRMLDLYSGTGAIGIESLSRGASECIFVDTSKECVDCNIANAWLAGFLGHEEAAKGTINDRLEGETAPMNMVGGPQASVAIELHKQQISRIPVGAINADAIDVLMNPEAHGLLDRKFNHIHASPPWSEVSFRQLCTALASTPLLERDGLVTIEYPRELGILPPILNAQFENPEDQAFDDTTDGVPMLYGVRNRKYGSTNLATYIKLPTGARGVAAEPRPQEFMEPLITKKLRVRHRSLYRTPSLWSNRPGVRGFARPEKKKRLAPAPEEGDAERK